MTAAPRSIRHGECELALHQLSLGDGQERGLLLLHALGSSHREWQPLPSWPGPIWALDFAGHGGSSWRAGGAYMPELFAADAAVAVAGICATRPPLLVGRGLGAYAALLLAGARPRTVQGAILLAGEGLAGGGESPSRDGFESRLESQQLRLRQAVSESMSLHREAEGESGVDPRVWTSGEDFRPSDYAVSFADAAAAVVLVEADGAGEQRPPWWDAVRVRPGVVTARDLATAIALLAGDRERGAF